MPLRPLDPFRFALSFLLGLTVPKDPRRVVFGGRHYGGNTAPVFERARDVGLEPVWLTTRPDVLSRGRDDVIDARSLRGLWEAARAGGVALTHSLGDLHPVVFPSRRTKLFNLWHGMPIKRISRADPRFQQRRYARQDLREMRRFEAMFVTSERMAEIFADTFLLQRERVHRTGQPRNDVLFDEPSLELLDRYDPPLPPHGRRILYCPTWREHTPVRLFPFPDRDVQALDAELSRLSAVMFVRTHPSDPGRLDERWTHIVPMQGDVAPEVNDVLAAFDVLVTDYSSVWYDWLLLDRPAVFLPYDLDEYARAPGFYVPFEEIAAGPCPDTQRRFADALREAFDEPAAFADDRARVRQLVYDHHADGEATGRVLEVIRRALLG